MNLDEDAMIAAIDLVGRSGATEFEFGYLNDDVPVEQADWWAKAQYRGARIQVEHHRGPVEAAEALARRVLDGARCNHCKQLVTLGGEPRPGVCRWSRSLRRWERSCLAAHPDPARRPRKRMP